MVLVHVSHPLRRVGAWAVKIHPDTRSFQHIAEFIDSAESTVWRQPSSRTALMGKQPNPWDLLQPPGIQRADMEIAEPFRRMWSLGQDKPVIPGVPFYHFIDYASTCHSRVTKPCFSHLLDL